MADYVLLDTAAFESFISSQKDLEDRYNEIQSKYSAIVKSLLEIWRGRGAEAFEEDSKMVMSNIVGIHDILSTMCDTLNDCYEIFAEADHSLGVNNSEVAKN